MAVNFFIIVDGKKIYPMKKAISAKIDPKIYDLARRAAYLDKRSFTNLLEVALEEKSKVILQQNK